MNVKEFIELDVNKAQAYILGLIFPLYKTTKYCGREYVIGSVNHNSNMINQVELAQHYNKIYRLINENIKNCDLLLLANKTEYGSVSSKEGFSILIEKGNNSDEEIKMMFSSLAQMIKKKPSNIKKEFIKGCFDGRSSWDTTAHYISLDIDRDYGRQDIIAGIIEDEGIEVNLNRRDLDHKKNDQIRIKKKFVKKFMNEIGLYSECRTKLILNGLEYVED